MRNLIVQCFWVLVFIAPLISCNSQKTSSISAGNPLVGTWELCSWRDSLPAMIRSGGEIFSERKIITPETFTVLHLQEDKKLVYSIFTGTCSLNNGIYSEKIEYSNDRQLGFVGTSNSFTFRLEKEYLFVSGTNNKYNQIWKRIKK